MRILSVVPILRGVAPDVLSYYTSLTVAEGALVEIPIRKKYAPALVIAINDATQSASSLLGPPISSKKYAA